MNIKYWHRLLRGSAFGGLVALALIPLSDTRGSETVSKKPDFILRVTVDGKRATGFMELALQFPDTDNGSWRKPLFDKAFDAATIKVKKGQRLRLKVEIERDGKLDDVTADPNLYVDFLLDQMQRVSPTDILVQPESDAPLVKDRGLIEMTLAYQVQPGGKVGYNQILFELVP